MPSMLNIGAWICFVLFIVNLVDWMLAERTTDSGRFPLVAAVMLVLALGFYFGEMAVRQ